MPDDASNVMEIVEGYDVIVDGADNFRRYLLNDAPVKTGIPVVHGSIFRFEGQVTVFDPRRADLSACRLSATAVRSVVR